MSSSPPPQPAGGASTPHATGRRRILLAVAVFTSGGRSARVRLDSPCPHPSTRDLLLIFFFLLLIPVSSPFSFFSSFLPFHLSRHLSSPRGFLHPYRIPRLSQDDRAWESLGEYITALRGECLNDYPHDPLLPHLPLPSPFPLCSHPSDAHAAFPSRPISLPKTELQDKFLLLPE